MPDSQKPARDASDGSGHRVTPAGEWLLDNLYLIDEQIRTARRHFPQRYSFELPRLERGASAGLPRVYDIALNAISHGDGRVDQAPFSLFVRAYPPVGPPTRGRLGAIPSLPAHGLTASPRPDGGPLPALPPVPLPSAPARQPWHPLQRPDAQSRRKHPGNDNG